MSAPLGTKRLPRNAAPIPFPTSGNTHAFLSTSPRSFGADWYNAQGRFSDHPDHPIRSPSSYSEIEVVLDDGTLQKRTVSLSTMPESYRGATDEEDMDMSNEEALSPTGEQRDASELHSTSHPNHQATVETTPLLRGNKQTYASVSTPSSSSTSADSDSDTPFFPAGRQRHHRHYSKKSDADHPSSSSSGFRRRVSSWRKWCQKAFTLTPERRLVLKCSFAYFIASLFTFVPAFNALIGNNRVSSHLVATATVFFNPAKTLGGMVEAALYGWGYTLFALAICLGSMTTTDYFVDRDLYLTAHLLSLLFWLVGATFVVSFLKAHWNKPPVATASSLCFIIIFIIVVREGSANRGDFDLTRINQITSAVATGTLITVTCCIVFWPASASKKLKKDIEATLTSYGVLLKLLTKTFLLDDDLPEFKANKTLQTAIASHRASFTSLQKSSKEAKLEWLWNSDIRHHSADYDDVVASMQRLAQHVGGLRSSCGLQFELMTSHDKEAHSWKGLRRRRKRKQRVSGAPTEEYNIRAGYRRRQLEDEMRRQRSACTSPDIDHGHTLHTDINQLYQQQHHNQHHRDDTVDNSENGSLLQFIRTVRQPLKSLAYTCKQTIYHLGLKFTDKPPRADKTPPSLHTLKSNLEKAIALFETSQRQAAHRLQTYRMRAMQKARQSDSEPAPGEDVFLVYFFVFNMIEFARELICLVEAVERLSDNSEKSSFRNRWFPWHSSHSDGIREQSFSQFVPNERNTMNTLHTPIPETKWRRLFLRIWKALSMFKLQKMRYAIKASVACVLLAAPAFIQSTGPWFREWRMEWALITLMVVMTPTVGGTNIVAIYRIFSTALGCFSAMALYILFPGNMYVLPIATWLFSIPNFWLILHHKHGKFGQFTLLAYNLVMLNKYNDRDTNNTEVWLLALQRCGAIVVGVVFGIIATGYVWPYEARVELRKGLSDFLLRLAWLYQKLVSFYPKSLNDSMPGTLTHAHMHMTEQDQRQYATRLFMDLELSLQRSLLELQALLAQTPNEPRLKGAFPVETYQEMLGSCQSIVDKFLSMRALIMKDVWLEEVQRNFVIPASKERREMIGNVLLYFYLLASALRLKTPLPPYFPPARKAWESLIYRLRELPISQASPLPEKDNVYVFYYAYETMMEDIIRELDKLGQNMTRLFGAIIPPDQWELLFENEDPERGSSFIEDTASSLSHHPISHR